MTSNLAQAESYNKLTFNVTIQNDNSKSNDSSSDVTNQNENSKNDDILPKTGKTLKNMNLLSIAFFITGLLLILRKKYLI